MLGITITSFCILDYLTTKRVLRPIFLIVDFLVITTITVFLFGGFNSYGSTSFSEGLGIYSANLNSFWNPMGRSSFFKALPHYTPGQYEGFCYLGAGCILLLFLGTCLWIKQVRFHNLKKNIALMFPLIFLIGTTLIIALSPIGSFNDVKLYELKIPYIIFYVWSIFRASGRFIVILGYILMFYGLYSIYRLVSYRTAIIIVLFCLFIQLYDIKGMLLSYRYHYNTKTSYTSPLVPQNLWNEIAMDKKIKYICIVNWLNENNYYDIAFWGIRNNKMLGSFAVAHPDSSLLLKNVKQHLQAPQEDEVFIFQKNSEIPFFNPKLHYYDANDYLIGYINRIDNINEIHVRTQIIK